MIKVIAAIAKNGVIGRNNDLPWKLPDDMKRFREQTWNSIVVMGSRNYFSIPTTFRPLTNRENIVLSRSPQPELEKVGCTLIQWPEVLERSKTEDIWVIGGAEIYDLALSHTDEMYLTRVHAVVEGDVFFPVWDPKEWVLISSEDHPADDRHLYSFTWEAYRRNTQPTS